MASFTLNVSIDKAILAKQPPDNLQITKKVNGTYATTFAGGAVKPTGKQSQLLEYNVFEWTEDYAVSLSTTNRTGSQVSSSTDHVSIQFGQKAVYDATKSSFNAPIAAGPESFKDAGSDPKKSLVVGSIPEKLHASLSCRAAPDSDTWLVIYVDTDSHAGVIDKTITPMNQYALFWDKKIVGPTIITHTKTVPYEFLFLPGQTELSLRWGYETPEKPSYAGESPGWYPVKLPSTSN